MLNKLLHLRFAVIAHDLMMAWLAWLASYALRYSIWPDSPQIEYLNFEVLAVVLTQGVVAYFFNLYRGLWRFASIPDLSNIIKAAVFGTVIISLFYFLLNRLEGVPRSVLLMYPVLLTLFWGLPRISYRLWKDKHLKYTNKNPPRVLLVGAGTMADSFIRNSVSNASYKIVSIVDDRARHQGAHLRGIKIKGGLDQINAICQSQEVELIVIAKQDLSSIVIKKIIDQSVGTSSKIRILPDPDDLENSGFDMNQLQPLTVEDLLGREKIQLDWTKVAEFVKNRSVLITGGGGSIGSELCRQLARFGVSQMTIVDHAEYNLYTIDKELADHDLVVHSHLCDITNKAHLFHIFNQVKPDIVFHAAAYKHVPLLENLSSEGFMNNVIGTKIIADTCDEFSVDKMILISTDKAVNPFSVMGATKRIAEKYCQYKNQHSSTDYIIVRFGNVLGSAGSVVPLFKQQIESGGPVTVTHPDMTRYFMTIEEACQLILQGMVIAEKNNILVLDMGEPININTLAQRMITLSGKSGMIKIVITGLRSGEKLNEQLFYEIESLDKTANNKIFTVKYETIHTEKLVQQINKAYQYAIEFDQTKLRRELQLILPEFTKQTLTLLDRTKDK